MKVLNLKDMPPELMRKIKMTAAMQNMTIKYLVIEALETYLVSLEAYLQNGGKK